MLERTRLPRAAGDGKFYGVGIIGVQDPVCPNCGHTDEHQTLLDGEWGTPITVQDHYVSTTTVINATLPKDGLVGWAYNIAVEGMLDLAQEKGWDLSKMDFEMAKSLLKEFGFTSYAKRDEKGETGTRAHDVLETFGKVYLFHTEKLDASHEDATALSLRAASEKVANLPLSEKGYGEAVLDYLKVRAPKPVLVERPMACHHHGVAGTGDLYWEVTTPVDYQRLTEKRKLVSWEIHMAPGAKVLTDLKTSGDFRESHFIQVAWYGDHMIVEDLGLPLDHKTVLRVNDDGTWEEKEALGWSPSTFEALLQAKQALETDKESAKRKQKEAKHGTT